MIHGLATKIREDIRLDEQEQGFETKAELTLWHNDKSVDIYGPEEVSVSFDIELDYRSWGIAGAIFSITKPISIIYDVSDLQTDEVTKSDVELVIPVDVANAALINEQGTPMTIVSVDVRVNADGSLDKLEIITSGF